MNWKNTVYYTNIRCQVASPSMGPKYPLMALKSRSYTKQLNLMRLPLFYKQIQHYSGIKTYSNSDDKDFLKNCFFNQCFDKGRLKNFVLWFLKNYGQNKTVKLVEQLKNIGFEYASKAGISLGIDDLKIPYTKYDLIYEGERTTTNTIHQYVRGEITGVERFQRLIDTWHRTSESLKQEVIDYFEATDILNPVYMMAFSGARGNISQVRQLVGMRGLMADPQGQIIDFPIRSNFREGLTLTEYLISSYGARKGIVDTALRTANAGYLTRRLVDVAQHVIISHFDCGTHRGIFLKDMKEGNKTIHSLIQRVVGRILARDLIDTSLESKLAFGPTRELSQPNDVVDKKDNTDLPISNGENLSLNDLSLDQTESVSGIEDKDLDVSGKDLGRYPILAKRNDEITMDLAISIVKKFDKIFVRSPLTCETNQLICQLCYGWSLGQGSTLVSIGEAVGVVAAQSIGEPGTQLTMRTFHTGGVFSGDISDQIRAPFYALVEYSTAIPGTLIRTPEGKIAFLTKGDGSFSVKKIDDSSAMANENINSSNTRNFKIPSYTLLYIRNKQSVNEKEVIAQISTISRKTNATDAAQLTIQSEYEGQFFSKALSFREKYVGDAKLIESTLAQLRNQKNTNSDLRTENNLPFTQNGDQHLVGATNKIVSSFPTIKKTSNLTNGLPGIVRMDQQPSSPQKKDGIYSLRDRFNRHYIDKLYEAWNWGYAWVLSGKIYQLNLRGETCFPKLGDLVTCRSSMNQTQWNFQFNNGPAKVYYPPTEPAFGGLSTTYLHFSQSSQTGKEPRTHLNGSFKLSKLFNSTSSLNILPQDTSMQRRGRSPISDGQNEPSATVRAQKFMDQTTFDPQASNVTIAQPFFFLDILKIRFKKYGYILTSRNKSSSFETHFFGENFLRNDLLFRMYDIHSRVSNTLVKKKNLRTPQKNSIEYGNRTLLHWFPNQSQTSTGGIILFEKLFSSLSQSHLKINKKQRLNITSDRFTNANVSKSVGKSVFALYKQSLRNQKIPLYSHKYRNPNSKNLEVFGNTFSKTETEPSNMDSRSLKRESLLPQLRSGCIRSPLQNPQKSDYFGNISELTQFNFTNPKFSPVRFIQGRALNKFGIRNLSTKRGNKATLSLKKLFQSSENPQVQSDYYLAGIERDFTSNISGTHGDGVLVRLKDKTGKKYSFSPQTKFSRQNSRFGKNLGLPTSFSSLRFQANVETQQNDILSKPFSTKSLSNLNGSLRKQYVSPSFKADFIKQLNTELNSEKTRLIAINNKFKDYRPQKTRLKPLSSLVSKFRTFGMRWKNSYKIAVTSRFEPINSPNHSNKDKTNSVNSFISNAHPNVYSISQQKRKNENFSLLFNKRILWVPNQFFQLITPVPFYDTRIEIPEMNKKDFISNKKGVLSFWDKNMSLKDPFLRSPLCVEEEKQNPQNNIPVENPLNVRPKEMELFFSKGPLFLQSNRQGHLKPFTSFINFPSLVNTVNCFKGKNLAFKLDFNDIKATQKTLSYIPFRELKRSSITESFGLNQKWTYCLKTSNKRKNNLESSNTQNKYILPLPTFPVGKTLSPFFYYNNKYSLGELDFHFITFCTLSSFNEKKSKETWVNRLKKNTAFSPVPENHLIDSISQNATTKDLSVIIPKTLKDKKVQKNKFLIHKVHFHKSRSLSIVSNSIKRQLKKRNGFVHSEQLSFYLLSLNFKSSFIKHSLYMYLDKTNPENFHGQINSSSANSNIGQKSKTLRTSLSSESASTKIGSSPKRSSFVNTNRLSHVNLPFRSDPFSTENDFSVIKDEFLRTRKSLISNINLKKGWIYLSNNSSKILAHHKTILYPGQINDFNLNSSMPLYLECHAITDVFDFQKQFFSSGFHYSDLLQNSYLELDNSSLPKIAESGVSDVSFKNKKCIKNRKSRFGLPADLLNIKFNPQKKNSPVTHFVFDLEDFKSSYNNNLLFSSHNNIESESVEQTAIFTDEVSPHFDNNKYQSSLTKSYSKDRNLHLMEQKRQILLVYLNQLQLFKDQCLLSNNNLINNSHIVLLVQPIEEYTKMNTKELKTYVSESTLKHHSVHKIQHVGCLQNSKSSQKRKRNILVNPYLNSLAKKSIFQTQQFNKQKLGSKGLSKFPTSDIDIYSMAIDKHFAIETSLGNEKIQTPYYRGLTKQKRPINLSPFFVSYNRPMGFDSIFKNQDVSLSYPSFSNFDSVVFPQISSNLSSFLNFYLTTRENQKFKYVQLTKISNKANTSVFNYPLKQLSLNLQNQISIKMNNIVQHLNGDFISRLVQSPCFSFQNIFQFKNPILTFENLQRDFFRTSKLYQNTFKQRSIVKKTKPISKMKSLTTRRSPRLNVTNSNMSSTIFSYSQRNEMFLGIQSLAKTNVFSPFNGEVVLLNLTKGCMVLTTSNLTSYYLGPKATHFNSLINSSSTFSQLKTSFQPTGNNNDKMKNPLQNPDKLNKRYPINNILVRFLNMTDIKLDFDLACKINESNINGHDNNQPQLKNLSSASSDEYNTAKRDYQSNGVISNIKSKLLKVSNLIGGKPNDLNIKVRLGDFCVYGDPITNTTAIQASGQLVHFNNQKLTLRRSQPIFISPKGILHKFDNDFIDPKTPVITLSYQKLKTGDIIQGIPKVEQFFEARTTKRGRFFRDSLPYLLKSLFKRYSAKLPLDLAVRQSVYKIQQILVDGVHRVYKAQGVTISDKHLEVIVKQMTSKVRIIDGAQTGFFQGEVIDLFFVEKINSFLMKKMTYEPLVLGITKASLEVDSFLSAASFQQTTRVLSKAALFRKKDFLKGLKENVILGNLIPAGTGFLVYIDL